MTSLLDSLTGLVTVQAVARDTFNIHRISDSNNLRLFLMLSVLKEKGLYFKSLDKTTGNDVILADDPDSDSGEAKTGINSSFSLDIKELNTLVRLMNCFWILGLFRDVRVLGGELLFPTRVVIIEKPSTWVSPAFFEKVENKFAKYERTKNPKDKPDAFTLTEKEFRESKSIDLFNLDKETKIVDRLGIGLGTLI